MSTPVVKYSCVLLNGTNKKGLLRKDESGYYECALGAFNTYNSQDQYYPLLDSVKAMFEPGGSLRRRLDSGLCKGEMGHPSPERNQSVVDFIKRVLVIDPARVAVHIKAVTLQPMRDETGKEIVLAMGQVKPTGPFGDGVEKSLSNPEENAAFSIRSLADEKYANSRVEKHVSLIVTWDYVSEPGIAVANKFRTPTLESRVAEVDVTPAILRKLERERVAECGLEGKNPYTMVLTDLGWTKVGLMDHILKPRVEIDRSMHRYLKW